MIDKLSEARNFVKQLATDDDLAELLRLISDRHKFLNENDQNSEQ